MTPAASHVTLRPETLDAFNAYITSAEVAINDSLQTDSFLWCNDSGPKLDRLRKGEVLAELWSGKNPITVPHGLIHDWIGGVFVLGSTIDAVLAVIQNYDHHKDIYAPDVVDSKLLSRKGDEFNIYLRLLKKKIITVVLDTDHDVHYERLSSTRCCCRSYTTRVAEVDHAGQENESISAPDTGYGFLWRLNSYWKFEQTAEGTFIECRAISLTRSIPTALKLVVQPMVRTLPKESLTNTLAATRKALLQDISCS